MAENSGRGNISALSALSFPLFLSLTHTYIYIVDAADAPKGGDVVPPPVADDVKDAVKTGAETAGAGMHASGQEDGLRPDPTTKVKTAEELQKERKDGVHPA
ncbi:hypothetical protein E0Z10_g2130 [Xylaria hypoxylon]|uniref:SMP domain-containing protein n=1 Tax=Xylaria hypoxylon TaxID=37992 RepID=A0A4Z0Z374_9PEZI|nr:hypothetical protein E0Z10_g2130 [Xylaria hypoxylon]